MQGFTIPNGKCHNAQSVITATLAGINPTVQISADTAAYVWLKSNATADVLVSLRPLLPCRLTGSHGCMPGTFIELMRVRVIVQC